MICVLKQSQCLQHYLPSHTVATFRGAAGAARKGSSQFLAEGQHSVTEGVRRVVSLGRSIQPLLPTSFTCNPALISHCLENGAREHSLGRTREDGFIYKAMWDSTPMLGADLPVAAPTCNPHPMLSKPNDLIVPIRGSLVESCLGLSVLRTLKRGASATYIPPPQERNFCSNFTKLLPMELFPKLYPTIRLKDDTPVDSKAKGSEGSGFPVVSGRANRAESYSQLLNPHQLEEQAAKGET